MCLCNSCARRIRNLGTVFEVIRNAIGSESAVSQTPPKQSINLCKRLLQTPSGNSPCRKNVRVDSSVSEKRFPQVFAICRGITNKNDLLEPNLNIDDSPAGEEIQVKIVIVNWRGSHYKNSRTETRKVTSSFCSYVSRSNEHT